MANVVGLRLSLPVLGSVCVCYSSTFATTKKLNWKVKGPPRRMVLGLGASFFSHFMTMLGAMGSSKSFMASAKITAGPSVDEVTIS